MSKPIAVIIGATGGQGGSVVESFLKDGTYQVRGVTRNVNSANAQALHKRGVELVNADLNNEASLTEAFKVCDHRRASLNCIDDKRDLLSSSPSPISSSPSQPRGLKKQ